MEGKVVLAASELGIFDRLRGWGLTAAQMRDCLQGDLRGVEILLDALVALEILEKKDGVYRNRPEYEPFLVSGGPDYTPGLLRHRNRMFRNWALLEDRVLGRPLPDSVRERSILNDARENESFVQAMFTGGAGNASLLADKIDFEAVNVAADLGGGPGHYLAEFLRRKRDLQAYLLDLPLTLASAQRILAGSEAAERIRFVEWDFYHTEAPHGLPLFDLVLVSSVLHSETPDMNRMLLARLAPLVRSGGSVFVHEALVSEDRTWPVESALFAVNMLAGTAGGRSYTEREIVEWFVEAGFARVAVQRLSPRSCLLHFKKV